MKSKKTKKKLSKDLTKNDPLAQAVFWVQAKMQHSNIRQADHHVSDILQNRTEKPFGYGKTFRDR